MSVSLGFDPTTYRSEIQQTQHAASEAYAAALRMDEGPQELVRNCWSELTQRSRGAIAAGGPDGQPALAAAAEALRIMQALLHLSLPHRRALRIVEQRRSAGSSSPPEEVEAARLAILSNDVLSAFQASRDKAAQERAAEAEANRASIAAQQQRDRPRDLLAELRSRGLTLELSDDARHVKVKREHFPLLQAAEVDTIRARGKEIVALLQAEAAAAFVVLF